MNNKYPRGVLNATDEGALQTAIGVEQLLDEKRVVIRFNKPVAWLGLDPEGAVQMALVILKHAVAAGYTKPIQVTVGE